MARRQSRKNVVNTVLGAMGAAVCSAAIKRFLNLFSKKQYYSSATASTSTMAPLGRPATAKQERAGLLGKYLA